MPLVQLKCKHCGAEVELYVPLYSQREQRVKEVPCKCGENEWRIMPPKCNWAWGAAIRTGGEK